MFEPSGTVVVADATGPFFRAVVDGADPAAADRFLELVEDDEGSAA